MTTLVLATQPRETEGYAQDGVIHAIACIATRVDTDTDTASGSRALSVVLPPRHQRGKKKISPSPKIFFPRVLVLVLRRVVRVVGRPAPLLIYV